MEHEKLYGLVYTRMALKYILEFEAKKLREEPPQNIQGLEEVVNYIIANLDRYPNGHCALHYGTLKAEFSLQGGIGVRKLTREIMKNLLETSGFLKSLVGTTESAYEAVKMLPLREMKLIKRLHCVRAEGKNEVIGTISDCPFKDSCRALVEKGMSRRIGGLHCTMLTFGTVAVEIITGKNFAPDKIEEPHCIGRVFEI
ncbi:MAG: hypothetical protein QXO71_05375 [Candidatus Jordarchaeaceae archaeon]